MLFCKLTKDQRDLYRSYLASQEVDDILEVHGPLYMSQCIAVYCRAHLSHDNAPSSPVLGSDWQLYDGSQADSSLHHPGQSLGISAVYAAA